MRSFLGALSVWLILTPIHQANAAIPAEQVSAPTLQPLSEWKLIQSQTDCRVERPYGEASQPVYLGLHESVSGASFDLIVVGVGKGPSVPDELPGQISGADQPIKRWSLHFASVNGANSETFRLTSKEMLKVAAVDTITLHVLGAPDETFKIGGSADALRQLDQCTESLRHEWRVGLPDAPEGIKGPRADVRTPFAMAAPGWIHRHLRSGTAQFIVFVDQTGKIAGCDVAETAGSPLLEELGCEVIMSYVRAEPAHDRTGKPVRDSFETPPLVAP